MSSGERFGWARAWDTWIKVSKALQSLTSRMCFSGSMRRRAPDFGDVDILCIPKVYQRLVAATFREICDGQKLESSGGFLCVGWVGGVSVNVFMTTEESWGAALHYTTGSMKYNVAVRARAKGIGLLANEKGVFDRKTRRMIPGSGVSEGAYCQALRIPWLQPMDRTGSCFGQERTTHGGGS
jgi:DNA polymerase (family 10)